MKIGILTFYCSDNCGAMLQAYGLKQYIKSICQTVDIIPYAPPFLTGRHWFFPYYPGMRKNCKWAFAVFKRNLRQGRNFYILKSNMNRFRKKYLADGTRTIRTLRGLEKIAYDIYVVGSDQIWNPEITFGLRRAYFGAFRRPPKSRVVAYAASMGGGSLPERYSAQMKELLKSVDCLSVREKAAISYLRSLTDKKICPVSDPVFFIEARKWEALAVYPKDNAYILLYSTERNFEMNRYVKELSNEKGLKVIELRLDGICSDLDFEMAADAGPSEFLGYVQHASYIVTNSFHAVAFSIIFHKQFLVFGHSTRNARLENLLLECGLEGRLVYGSPNLHAMDQLIHWNSIEEKKEQMTERSKRYLINALTEKRGMASED